MGESLGDSRVEGGSRWGKFPAHRLIGGVLVAVAAMTALGPDFPLSRQCRTELKSEYTRLGELAAAELALSTAIEVYGPVGVTDEGAEFAWIAGFEGKDWHVVLLSENRQELAWSPPLSEARYRPQGEFKDALARKGTFLWYAVGSSGDGQVMSQPVRIEVR